MSLPRRAPALVMSVCIAVLNACGQARQVDDAALRDANADSADWLTYGRTYSEQRHSTLRQIDERSVSRLGLT